MPCHPSRYKLQKTKQEILQERGMYSPKANSAMLDIESVIARCKAQNPQGIDGIQHLQVSVDAMRQYKNCKVTNFAIRSLTDGSDYNHLQSLNIAGIRMTM